MKDSMTLTSYESKRRSVSNFSEWSIFCQVPDAVTQNAYQRSFCGKSFKKVKSLTNHLHSVHQGEKITDDQDYLQNYSKNAQALCYIVENFQDARKYGDGDRVIRLYKFLLIHFEIDDRSKYAYQSLHLLAQIIHLLPRSLAFELKWNRFVNTQGKVDTYVELDRHLEHLNKYVKTDLKQFQGKITDKSVARCSRSYFKIQRIIDQTDKQLYFIPASGRHSCVSWEDDVKQLGEQLNRADIFHFEPGQNSQINKL